MKFSKYISKAVTPVMALFQKQHRLPFKQGYDNLRSFRQESAADSGTAQSGRQQHRNQSAVSTSHNVPSDTKASHPERWNGRQTRDWSDIEAVYLNPDKMLTSQKSYTH